MFILFIFVTLPLLLSGCTITGQIEKERGFVVDFVSWIFEDLLQYILFTPFEFFKTETATGILFKMGIFSAALVTILAMVEGFKRMLSMNYTSMSRVFSRYPIALIVSAFAPTLFYYAGWLSNELVRLMGILTGSSMDGVDKFANVFQDLGYHIYESFLTFFFLCALIFYFMRILMFHAVRWFGLLFNMVMTPVAMTAFIFAPYENVSSGWLKDTVSKFVIVVAHSFFLGLIGIILYAPHLGTPEGSSSYTFGESMVRMMMAIGGLHMMLYPPAWISSWFDRGGDIRQSSGVIKKAVRLILMSKGIK